MPNKQRIQERQQERIQAAQRQKRRTYAIAGGIAAVVIGLVIVFALTGRSASSGGPVALGNCGNVQDLPEEGRNHLSGSETPVYQTNPPTSGDHNEIPEGPGVYANPRDLTMLVHSMEHGYVIIYHRDLTQDEVVQLANIVRGDQRKVIMNPYPASPARVVLTAWTHMQQCGGVNETAIRQFISAYRDQGPERTAQ